MIHKQTLHKTLVILIVGFSVLNLIDNTYANPPRYMERLDRGVVAVYQGGGQVYIGWRMFGTEPDSIAFNVYRNSVKINSTPITNSTNYTDTAGSVSYTYSVSAIIDGIEQQASAPVAVWAEQYLTVPLQTPTGYTPNDASVGDLDGDGQYEIVLHQTGAARDNSQSGFTDPPLLQAYELDGTMLWEINLGINIREGAHYTQFMVYDLDNDGRAEVACKTADGTVDGIGTVMGDPSADWRNDSGYILDGPEFFTVFDGQTGVALHTVDYVVPRGNVCDWGDCYGNRVDRFLACVAYLDGVNPSVVMCRGYYTRAVLAAWDFRNGKLTQRWVFDSYDGTPGNSDYSGQGNHNLSVGDVDGDGKDEIMYGACAIDDDGTGLYSTGLHHGDAMHLSDLDPDRPGLEVFTIHEGSGPGSSFRDALTGQVLWMTGDADVGRGVSADIDPTYPGYECWGFGGIRSCTGQLITSTNPPSTNHVIWWDDDVTRELLNGEVIDKWHPEYNSGSGGSERLLTAYHDGADAINGTKSNPCLHADILGDWREEVIWRHYDNQSLLIFTTTIPTSQRFYTFMHDPVYRLSVAWQNVAYNQPTQTGFYMGAGMDTPPTPNIQLVAPQTGGLYRQWWLDVQGNNIDDLVSWPDYPNNPTGQARLQHFEGPVDWNNNYGTRVRGYLIPPQTGDYTFWVAADDSAELYLSSDAIDSNAELIAEVTAWTDPHQWDKYAGQQSSTISLVAGRKYYIELLHKEGTGGDHFAVAWQGPGLSQQVIEEQYLMPWSDRTAGDVTGNDKVNLSDLLSLTDYWLVQDCSLELEFDMNGDCQVNLEDFALMSSNWLYGMGNGEISTIQIQENEAGFLTVTGTIDSNNAGYTGTGFANTTNESGSYIEWSVNVPAAGTYDLQWRYANGSSNNRTAAVRINGLDQLSGVDFISTSSWTTWDVSLIVGVSLKEGNNIIRLYSETSEGLANIDWIEITGNFPMPGTN